MSYLGALPKWKPSQGFQAHLAHQSGQIAISPPPAAFPGLARLPPTLPHHSNLLIKFHIIPISSPLPTPLPDIKGRIIDFESTSNSEDFTRVRKQCKPSSPRRPIEPLLGRAGSITISIRAISKTLEHLGIALVYKTDPNLCSGIHS